MKKFALVFILLSTVLFGCGKSVSSQPAVSGKKVMEEICVRCHPLDKVTSHRDDKTGWRALVNTMSGYGATFTEEQKTAVIDYLVKTQPK